MIPYSQAKGVYETEPCTRSFEEDLMTHFLHGFVFSTPDYFVMGRGVWSKAKGSDIVNPHVQFPKWQQDCWHCYLMAGDIGKAWDILPYPLPMFSLERSNELRFYRFDAVARHAPFIHA